MMPRLYLAKNLLRQDGVIFVSIDDNEVHNLRLLMNEIFGEENFVASIIWHKRYAASNDAKGVPTMHDYILMFQKSDSFERKLMPRTDKQNSLYKYDSNDEMGLWRPDNLTVKTVSESYLYEITNPNTGKTYKPTQGRCWLTSEARMIEWIKEGRVFFGQDGNGAPQLKRYLSEVQDGVVPNTYWSYDEVGHTDSSRKELKSIFETSAPFDNPKERIRRASKKIKEEIKAEIKKIETEIKKLQGEIPREETKSEIQNLKSSIINLQSQDLGFKVLKLDDSNFKQWQQIEGKDAKALAEQMKLFVDPVSETATIENMGYELLLKSGKDLNSQIEKQDSFYKINENELVLLLEKATQEIIDAVIAEKPNKVIALDKLFKGNDQLKTNTVLQMKDAGIEFKTI